MARKKKKKKNGKCVQLCGGMQRSSLILCEWSIQQSKRTMTTVHSGMKT